MVCTQLLQAEGRSPQSPVKERTTLEELKETWGHRMEEHGVYTDPGQSDKAWGTTLNAKLGLVVHYHNILKAEAGGP